MVPSIRVQEGEGPVIKEVQCECGFYARGTAEDLVPVVQAHAKAKHGMDVTREQVIAQLKPYEA
jgi:predicted small metal-binding protein